MRLRTNGFRLVMTNEERRLLTDVAESLRRSESDTVRWLITEEALRRGVISTTTLITHRNSSQAIAKRRMSK
jgi:hypothetical protein